jgi:NAD(P)-dependent dehydrogenase (short-subunit alcohol dehydrogenase family)
VGFGPGCLVHGLDSLVIADIDLDAQSGTARRLDLDDRAIRPHVLGFGLEFLIRVKVEVVDTKASTHDPALLQLVTEMNLFGTVYSCNAVAPIMKQHRSAKIMRVSSVAGTAPSAEGGEARILCCASRGTEGAFHIMGKSGVKQV